MTIESERGVVLREASEADTDVACDLLVEYLQWAIERLRQEYGVEWPPVDRTSTQSFLQKTQRPEGAVVLALLNGKPVGVGAFRKLEPGVAEIKRMYVVPAARGHHVGSAILDFLLREAELDHNRVIRLDTLRFMSDAQRLYRSRGFVERSPYAGTEIPPELHRYWRFFEKSV